MVIAAGLMQCGSYREKMLEKDKRIISNLNLYMEQEALWVAAVSRMDSVAARQAKDSIYKVLGSMDEIVIPAGKEKDSLYFAGVIRLREVLHMLNDSVYPDVDRIAFLPEMAFTWKEEEALKQLVRTADSLIQLELENVFRLRQSFLQRHLPQQVCS